MQQSKLTHADLYKLEDYANLRDSMRSEVMEEKKRRRIAVGPNLTLIFENRMTIQYQIQEMLRIERIFEADAIQEELDAYNPLIPDGSNWKATAMVEYPDVEERRAKLQLLKGIEDLIWVQVGDFDRVYAIADEDLERSNEEKTSAVHFLRFELPDSNVEAARAGAQIRVGVRHLHYDYTITVDDASRDSLAADLG